MRPSSYRRFTGASSTSASNQTLLNTRRAGFVPRSERLHRLYNFTVGLVLLLMALPIMLVIYFALLVTQGPSVFYEGKRLGRNQKQFTLYKFRTLDTEKAEALTKMKVLPKDSSLETPIGKFLRKTRLDELPQLINIVLGDMNICGPRPVRHEIAQIALLQQENYEIRFSVKPGLVGHSQAYMCHSTPKRLRALYNYQLCKANVSYFADISLFVQVGASVISGTLFEILNRLRSEDDFTKAHRLAADWQLYLETEEFGPVPVRGFENDRIYLDEPLNIKAANLVIVGQGGKLRKAKLQLDAYWEFGDCFRYGYKAQNEYSEYFIGRYLMRESVVKPLPPKGFRKIARPDYQGKQHTTTKVLNVVTDTKLS